MSKQAYIYSLNDPVDNKPRYIGFTTNIAHRYYHHLKQKLPTHKGRWINSLLKQKLNPILEIIEEVPLNEWRFWETFYICLYKSWGFDLTNGDYGGEGHCIW